MGEARRKRDQQPLRHLIADIVRGIYIPHPDDRLGGGRCMMRTLIGWQVPRRVGFYANIAIGGVPYRVGPDPGRNGVAFCGPYNAGFMVDGVPLFHAWNEVGPELLDFSVGYWRNFASTPDAWKMELECTGETLGPVQWSIAEPPPFWWCRIHDVRDDVWNAGGTWEPGRVRYGPITQDAANDVAQRFFQIHRELKDEDGPIVDMMLTRHAERWGEFYALPDRPHGGRAPRRAGDRSRATEGSA